MNARLAPLLIAPLLASACHHYRINPRAASDGSVVAAATEPESEVVWSLFWGLSEDALVPDCQGNGLAEVTVKTNIALAFLHLISLGIAEGAVMEWRCAKDSPTSGDRDF